MLDIRKFAIAGGTLACALGIGVYIQSDGPADAASQAVGTPSEVQETDLGPASPLMPDDASFGREAVLALENIALTSAKADFSNPGQGALLPDASREPEAALPGCSVSATAKPASLASLELAVAAPCHGNRRLSVHHNGMMFTTTTDALGNLDVQIPALSENAVVMVDFGGGQGAVTTTRVPDFGQVDRVLIQWSGAADFQIHAREFGASYGDEGHVWSGSEIQGLGSVVRLGDAEAFSPNLVEVYTVPHEATDRTGVIALSVETEVTNANCDTHVSAQTMQMKGADQMRVRDVVLTMPNCSAIGNFLVLNNLADDLKIAAK